MVYGEFLKPSNKNDDDDHHHHHHNNNNHNTNTTATYSLSISTAERPVEYRHNQLQQYEQYEKSTSTAAAAVGNRSPKTTAQSMNSSAATSPLRKGDQNGSVDQICSKQNPKSVNNTEAFHFTSHPSSSSKNGSGGSIESSSSSSSSRSTAAGESDDSEEDDLFGWYDMTQDTEPQSSEEIRMAWMKIVSTVTHDLDDNYNSSNNSISSQKSNNKMMMMIQQPIQILNEWHNPQPSLSLKLSSSDMTMTKTPQQGYGVSSSSCVSGLRICQYASGEIRAEFQFVFCYGSMSYMSWKPYSEFKKLAEIIGRIHKDSKPIFYQTIKQFQFLEEKKRWFRCLNMKYLIEKSILLGRFMEALLHESPSPGLILAFIQHNKLQSLPSW